MRIVHPDKGAVLIIDTSMLRPPCVSARPRMIIVMILSHSAIMLSLLMLSKKTVTGAYEHKNERRMSSLLITSTSRSPSVDFVDRNGIDCISI